MRLRRLSVCLLPALLALATACDGAPVDPAPPSGGGDPDPEPPVETADTTVLSADTLVLVALGDTASVVATNSDGTETESISYGVRSESRWFEEDAVLDTAGLRQGRLVAASPGRVTLDAVAFGNDAVPLVVRVEPETPFVRSVSVPDIVDEADTVVITGYRMDHEDFGVKLSDGSLGRFVSRDSASARLSFDRAIDEGCSLEPARHALEILGAEWDGEAEVERVWEGSVSYEIGEVHEVGEADLECLRFAPATDAIYGIAYVDLRPARHARESYDLRTNSWGGAWTFRARTGPAAEASVSRLEWGHAHVHAEGPRTMSTDGPPPGAFECDPDKDGEVNEGRQYSHIPDVLAPGDSFYTGDTESSYCTNGIVQGVWGRYVLVVHNTDLHADWPSRDLVVGTVADAMEYFAAEGEAVLRDIFTGIEPLTAYATGQVLVRVQPGSGFNTARATWDPAQPTPTSHVRLNYPATVNTMDYTGVLHTLVHEITHVWQTFYDAKAYDPETGHLRATAAQWAWEGVADLMASEVERRRVGAPPASNYDWDWSGQGEKSQLARFYGTRPGQTAFWQGYGTTMSLLHDYAARAHAAGASWEEAVRLVTLGAMEGWYGWIRGRQGGGDFAYRADGIRDRLAPYLGSDWSAEASLLLWMTSVMLDDIPSDPRYEIAMAERAQGPFTPWRSSNRRGHNADLFVRIGGSAVDDLAAERLPYHAGWIEIHDAGRGGSARIDGWSNIGSEDLGFRLARLN